MVELIREAMRFMSAIFPPRSDDPKHRARHDWAQSVAIVGLLVLVAVNVAIAYSILPPLWYAPETQFGQLQSQTQHLAEQVRNIANDVDMTLKLDLGKEMRDNQVNRCTATNSNQKWNLSNTLDAEQQYYYRRFGVYYQLPGCDQL